MERINVHEAKTHLSRYLRRVAKGESVIICVRNVPVARLVPENPAPKKRRPIGLYKGQIEVAEDFDDPMPEQWLKEFNEGPIFQPREPPKGK